MKALTLTQPWATLVAIGAKSIETRSWKTNYRGPLAIHAGKGLGGMKADEFVRLCSSEPFRSALGSEGDLLARGVIVATCELLEVLPITATPVAGHRTVALDEEGIVRVWKPGDIFGEPGHVGTSWPLAAGHEAAFGDYRTNRFAWILGDVRPLPEPVPATGRQGLWEWAEVVPA